MIEVHEGVTKSAMTFSRAEIEKLSSDCFTDNNAVHLIWKNKELFNVIFDSISRAKSFICLEFYIFRDDETGRGLGDLLKKKASEGVDVYVLYDHFGSFGTTHRFWKSMKDAGIRVLASHPFKWTSPLGYARRDHKKLIVIDGETAFTGGLNIANEYSGYYFRHRKRAWRDTGVLLTGQIAGTFFEEFKKSWKLWSRESIPHTVSPKHVKGGVPVLPIFASSSKGRRKLRRFLYYSINHAQKSIFLTTAYFTPSRRMIHSLARAVQRGAEVKLILPAESDVAAAHYAGRASYSSLLKAGVEIYNYHGEILHAKTAVFDSGWSIIGSANLDYQSLRWNDEGNAGILDARFGQQMTDVFNEDIKKSVKIKAEQWEQRGFKEKLKEWFFALFRKRL